MSNGGWMLLIVSWSVISGVLFYCLKLTFSGDCTPPEKE